MHSRLCLAGLIAASLLLAACGAKEDKKPATQAAARVNGAEITVHQINQVLTRLPGISEENAAGARQEVLNRLIDQQLAVEQAVSKKLDRQPDVMAMLEAARREVLARAYLEQLLATQGKPTAADAAKYYGQHPELFAERRIYNLQELTLEKNEALLPALRDKAGAAKNLEEVAAWLKEKNVRFNVAGGVRPAEQIPLEMLAGLHKLKDGQTLVMSGAQNMAQNIVVVRIAGVQSAPVSEAVAQPRILQFLANKRDKDLAEGEIKRLRETARIEYLGSFAADAAPAAAPAPAPAAPDKSDAGNVGKAVGRLK